jgi:hypothetical protein
MLEAFNSRAMAARQKPVQFSSREADENRGLRLRPRYVHVDRDLNLRFLDLEFCSRYSCGADDPELGIH